MMAREAQQPETTTNAPAPSPTMRPTEPNIQLAETVNGEPAMQARPVGDEFRVFAKNGCVSFPKYSKHGYRSAHVWSGSDMHSSSYA